MSGNRPESVSWGHPEGPSSSGTRPAGGKDVERVGKYRMVSEIGRGGMASVHLARMDGPGGFYRWVAIKRIHPYLIDDDRVIDMFLDEARMVAMITHANVAHVFDIGKEEDEYWIAMEYVHGEPLRDITRVLEERRASVPAELAARICADAAEGLHAAHELRGKSGQLLGLVHRDVTPHNLLVGYDGCTKVVDFGIALAAERLSITIHGHQLKGKIAYMSPEQVRGAPLDRRSDVFALGIVLWELTTGRRLFRAANELETLERVQACIVPPPSSVMADYPGELEVIVMKALSVKREERFATAREMSRALETFLVRSGRYVAADEVAAFVSSMFGERRKRRDEHLRWAAEVTSAGLGESPPPPFEDPATATPSLSETSDTLDPEDVVPTVDTPMPRIVPLRVAGLPSVVDDDDEDAATVAIVRDRGSSPPPLTTTIAFRREPPTPAHVPFSTPSQLAPPTRVPTAAREMAVLLGVFVATIAVVLGIWALLRMLAG